MTVVVALTGWAVAAVLLVELRRRAGLVADAAHELRGPLTAVTLGIEAIKRHPPARRRAEALATELCRVAVAAEDVAAAARGRRASARAARVGLKQLVGESSEAWRAAAARRGGRIVFDWQADGRSVRADPRRLAQAFGNLLANAVEHGGSEIVVRGRPSSAGIRVEVEDHGVATRPPPGARRDRGRGLAIAARALDDAGGRLVSFDRPRGGRVAAVELPAER